jgi:RNA polymerase sigma-70 factor (ECF subfamily)
MTKEAYQQLFEKHYQPLCNYAFAIIKDYDDAEDIVQGVFIKFWNNENKAEIGDKAKQYLVRSVKFKCIDYQRKETVKRKYEKEAIHEMTADNRASIGDVGYEEEAETQLKDVLMLAISELPEKTREVFMMSKIDGLRYKEIAEHLGISPKTVENQMGRAFKHLRDKLKDYKELLALIVFLFFE